MTDTPETMTAQQAQIFADQVNSKTGDSFIAHVMGEVRKNAILGFYGTMVGPAPTDAGTATAEYILRSLRRQGFTVSLHERKLQIEW